jgi:hypothetical protein
MSIGLAIERRKRQWVRRQGADGKGTPTDPRALALVGVTVFRTEHVMMSSP